MEFELVSQMVNRLAFLLAYEKELGLEKKKVNWLGILLEKWMVLKKEQLLECWMVV